MDFPKSVPGVGLVGGKFVDENQATGQVGSLIPSAWGNAVTEELLNVIQAAGLEPDEEQKDQLLKAVRKLRGGAVNFGLWQFSAAGGNPGAGRVTLNNGDPALATALLIAESSAEALDYSPSLGLLRAGDTVSLQERDGVTVSHRYRVTGPAVDSGAYRTIPVSYVTGSGGAPAVDVVLAVLFFQAAAYDDTALSGRVTALESARQLLHVRDVKPSGTSGGSFTSGAWRTRDLNTVLTNTIPGAALAGNQITLPAGTYEVEARAPTYTSAGAAYWETQARLAIVATSTAVAAGSSTTQGGNGSYAHTASEVRGRFTLAAPAVLELQHYLIGSAATFGRASAIPGTPEVYSDVIIRRVA